MPWPANAAILYYKSHFANRGDDSSDVILHVTQASKSYRLLRQLEEEGYEEGPGASGDVRLKEGDMLAVTFRGNVECEDTDITLELPFNSNMKTSLPFSINVVDKFLQKSYSFYRGFVQVTKRVKTVRRPNKDEIEDGVTGSVVEVKHEVVSEHLVKIPKVGQALFGFLSPCPPLSCACAGNMLIAN